MNDKDFLSAVIKYIEGSEVLLDKEYGGGRDLDELISHGYMPDVYAEALKRLENINNAA